MRCTKWWSWIGRGLVLASCLALGCAEEPPETSVAAVHAFARAAPAPSITSFTPLRGVQGTVVTIQGNNFEVGSTVAFNGTLATAVTRSSARQLVATVPPLATSGPIRVSHAGGNASSAQSFGVLPAITSVTPLEVFPGDLLSVLGTGFTGTTDVRLGGVAARFQRVSDTRLDVTVPGGATTAQLQVEKPSGVATSAEAVTVLPVLSGMSPTRGEVGSVVRLTGAGFTRVTTVKLGRLTAAFVRVDDRNLDATVPPAAVSARWEVIAPTSSARSGMVFEVVQAPVVQAPVVASFSPARSALPARVVLTGTGFTGVTSVTLAGLPLPFTQGSARTLTVEVPLGATSGRFAVTNPAGTGTSARDFVVLDRCAGVVCAAADACHVAGTCDPLTGACSAPIAADGTLCDDGLLCTVGDACLFGACSGEAVVCAARDACHVAGVCDPTTGACSDPPAADGTACDDHDACTLGDACVAGACAGDSRAECAAADQCRAVGACNPLSGACTGAPLPEGTACDDGEPSTTNDACTAGVCSGAVPAAGDVLQAEVEAGATVKTDSGDGATPRDAVETAVESPLDGLVSIAEVETVTAPPPGFVLLEQEVQIEAPVASPGMPLVLTFTLDSSLLPPGVTVGTLQVFRNGVLVPACAGAPGQADPDPCVSERATIGDDAVITVLTSHASEWNFGYLDLVRGKLATGKSHTCAIREEGPSGGRVYCWGSDVEGQLGNDAAFQSSTSPVLVPTMGEAIRVTAGHNHTCVLRGDGTVWCWGRGDEGQLGTGFTSQALPVRAGSFSDAVDVAAGSNHTCAVRASGSVECWGFNANGQLGNLTGANTASPQAVPNVSGALQVTGGGEHSCALYERLVNGSMRTAVKCWGKGNLLGDGTSATTPRRAVVVSGLDDVTALSAGTLHTCALRYDGTVACWGSGSHGQLGCGGNSTCLFPMSVLDVANVVQIAAGNQHTCALKADGEVSCWGDGSSGERGDGDPVAPALAPVPTLDLIGVKHLSAGFARTCALRSDGTVRCWGATTNDGTGANALGTGTTEITSTPVATSGVGAAAELASGLTHSCVRVGGGIRCWGARDRGQLGDGNTAPPIAATPVTVIDAGGLPFADAAQLAAGGQHSCVLRTAGTVACFGLRANGQLGDGLLPDATALPPIPEAALIPVAVSSLAAGGTPDPITGLPDAATQLAAGNLHTCAVLSQSGKVVCWGAGSEGQLGHGSFTAKVPAPVTVGLSTRATQVAAGGSHSCARLEDGRVACWGQARNGQLGHGAITPIKISTPVTSALDALDRATQVTTGGSHTCALLETRTVKCWGANGNGQLGTGTTALAASPIQVVGLSDVVQVAAGEQHTCALVEGGTVKCWGYGLFGQLGNGSTQLNSPLPVDVVGLADVVQLAAGSQHTCARRAGGSVACWGSGLLGQRGDNYPYAATPLPVPQMAPFGKCLDDNLCDGSESHDLYGACIEGTPLVVDDDGNACTSDFCDPLLGVQHAAVADGSACNDGNACTQSDACTAGACTGANPVVCAPPDACHGAGVCNSGTGACEYAALPDGTTCAAAADACTTAPTCIFGLCTGGGPITCNDGDACSSDGCNPFTGCTTAPIACDDANACTADSCDPFTGCGHTAVTCDDGIACTMDSCDPASGCSIASSTCGPIPGLGPIEFEIARPLAAENGWQFGPPKLADMNQDGNADLATLEVVDADYAMMAAVRLGQGDGTFLTPMLVPLAAEIGPGTGIDMEILDANADGALDIVATYNGQAGAALVALAGDGTGSLSVQRTIALDAYNPRLAVLDLDQNGLLDAVVGIPFAQGTISELRVYYDVAGTAEPSVSVESLPPQYWIRDLDIGDMDADGLSDLLVLGYDFSAGQSASILVGLNDASGGLEPSVPLIGLGRYGFALALRASNADAYPDIVVATADGILAFASSGRLSYGPPTVLGPLTDTSPGINGTEQRLITSDLDSDGNQDVAYAGPYDPLRLLFADNQGGTVVDVSLDTGYTVGVAAADLDHDGLVDLVTAGDAPRVVMGKAPRDFAAPTPIFVTPGAAPVGPLDLNGDAHPDFVLVVRDGDFDASIVEAVGSADGDFTLGAPTSLGGYFLWNHAILRGAQPLSQGVALVSEDLDGAGLQVVVFEVSSPDGIVGSQVLELPELDPSGSISVLAGSFAGDPSDELLVAYSAPTDLQTRLVSFSWEDGALGPPVTLAEYDGTATLMASLDANGDQRRDFVLWREDDASTTGYMFEVYLAQTDGTFTVAATMDMSLSHVDSVAAGDLTGDDLDELVIARSSCGSPENECVTILENMGDGSFEPLAGFSDFLSSSAYSPVIADFNNDLRNDLAFVGYGLTIVPGTDSGLGVERALRGISLHNYGVSDVTADGKLDLVAVSQFGLEVVVNVSGTEVISSPFCGDGTVQGSEICDDGNAWTETNCTVGVASCTVCAGDCSEELVLEDECGDGFATGAESCDDGNAVTEIECAYGTPSCVGCADDCSTELDLSGRYCGDGTVDLADGETCDDGNTTSGDGCSATCLPSGPHLVVHNLRHPYPAFCQAVIADITNVGDQDQPFGWTVDYAIPALSHAQTFFGQQALPAGQTMQFTHNPDLATTGPFDYTITAEEGFASGTTPCIQEVICGDGVVVGDEACDDGNTGTEMACPYGTASCSRCSADCTTELVLSGPYCGDTTIDATDGEMCDDGNSAGGDGCTATCRLPALAVAAGSGHTCMLANTGGVWCWGFGFAGQLGNGGTEYWTGDPAAIASAVPVLGIETATQVAAGGGHACAVLSDGSIRCWGSGQGGQLGNGSSLDSSTPVAVSGIDTAVQVAAGGSHTCAVLSDGSVWCWGSGFSGALGNGSTSSSSTPVTVSGIDTAVQVAAGGSGFTCAVSSDGSVGCWGRGTNGQLGNGSTSDSSTPVPVTGIVNAVQVAAGDLHACAVLSDGGASCWGMGSIGQLGNGGLSDSSTPVAVTGIDTAVQVAAGGVHTCALLGDDSVRCWGDGSFNRLGNGTSETQVVPVAATGIPPAILVSTGSGYTCAVKSDDDVQCVGAYIMP